MTGEPSEHVSAPRRFRRVPVKAADRELLARFDHLWPVERDDGPAFDWS